MAGNDITWSIQDAEQTDFESAEEMKIQHSHKMDSAPGTVQTAIEAFVNDIAGEIRRSFIYYQAQLREGSVDKMLISGGCARIEGLVEHLGENVGIPAALYDPYKGLNLTEGLHESSDLESLSPLIAGALGLALRRKFK
jgi:type IV pilus assembly protein PilM